MTDRMEAMEKIRRLKLQGRLSEEEWRELFTFWQKERSQEFFHEVSAMARSVREETFGKKVYIRGLIEFTSYCRNDCYYCGLRKSNQEAQRYRLDEETILACCKKGYELGFRTFVLQGGYV